MEGFEELLGVNFFNALFTLANTLALFFVFKKFLYVPIMNIIHERQQEIDNLYDAASKAKAEASAMQTEYQQKLSAAAETSERMVKEAVTRGQAREEEIIRQANQEAAQILNKAAADIALEKKKAVNDAKDEISGMAIAIAEKVVGRELSAADHSNLVDSFINELGGSV